MVEHLICNQAVGGSNPSAGSTKGVKMKKLMLSLLLLISFGFSEPISSIPENKYNLYDDVVYWAYATEDQQYGMIYIFVLSGNGALTLKKKKEDNPYEQLYKMKTCMDSTYNDIWMEFDHEIEIGNVMCSCAARLGWFD